jgi:hypothetical protein
LVAASPPWLRGCGPDLADALVLQVGSPSVQSAGGVR